MHLSKLETCMLPDADAAFFIIFVTSTALAYYISENHGIVDSVVHSPCLVASSPPVLK